MRDHNGDHVTAEDVLAPDELAQHYRAHGWPRWTGYEGVAIGADPAVVARESEGLE